MVGGAATGSRGAACGILRAGRDSPGKQVMARNRMSEPPPEMTLREAQDLIEAMYSHKDRQRGSTATFLWLCEEVGELAAAIREGTQQDKAEEFADVLAWIFTLANVEEIDLTKAFRRKYHAGCPGCGEMECTCDEKP